MTHEQHLKEHLKSPHVRWTPVHSQFLLKLLKPNDIYIYIYIVPQR